MNLRRHIFAAAIAAAVAVTFAPLALAQAQADYHAAPAGTYTVDPSHTAVIARVPHGGFSYEIFRFGDVSGQLNWDPANPGANRLDVTVATASIQTPVEGFAAELSEERFLNVAQFPHATFVSTAFRPTDATHGQVDGVLTLKGVARSITFNVELVGAGQGMRGGSVIGVHATARINNADYNFPGFIRGESEIVIDGEFGKP